MYATIMALLLVSVVLPANGQYEILHRNCDPDKLIQSATVCEAAAKKLLGSKFESFESFETETDDGIVDSSNFPAGCYAYTAEGVAVVFHNDYLNSTAQIRLDAGFKQIAVCRKKAATTSAPTVPTSVQTTQEKESCTTTSGNCTTTFGKASGGFSDMNRMALQIKYCTGARCSSLPDINDPCNYTIKSVTSGRIFSSTRWAANTKFSHPVRLTPSYASSELKGRWCYIGATASGPTVQTTPRKADVIFGEWSTFSTCTRSCGLEDKTRTRSCYSSSPHGEKTCRDQVLSLIETVDCGHKACPVDGGVGAWSTFSPCARSCGLEDKTRTRTCDSPSPAHGGKTCADQGHSMSETVDCGHKVCPAPTTPPATPPATTPSSDEYEILHRNCDPDKLIHSARVCEAAAKELLGSKYSEFNHENWPLEPAGCYAYTSAGVGAVFHNIVFNSTAQIDDSFQIAFCRKKAAPTTPPATPPATTPSTDEYEILHRNCDPDKLIQSATVCEAAAKELLGSKYSDFTDEGNNPDEPAGCYAYTGAGVGVVFHNSLFNSTEQINDKIAFCRKKTAPTTPPATPPESTPSTDEYEILHQNCDPDKLIQSATVCEAAAKELLGSKFSDFTDEGNNPDEPAGCYAYTGAGVGVVFHNSLFNSTEQINDKIAFCRKKTAPTTPPATTPSTGLEKVRVELKKLRCENACFRAPFVSVITNLTKCLKACSN